MFLLPRRWYAVKKIRNKGRGVFAAHDIDAGTVIGDYLGTIIKPDSNDERKDGMYDMRGGLKYDIVGDPRKPGIHFINHSCANNCDAYPYRGHILYFALRHIYKGEELSVNYGIGKSDDEDIVCKLHACHCGSQICTGTMHDNETNYENWEKLLEREFGPWYRKAPGKFGSPLRPLDAYPETIAIDGQTLYQFNVFGSEIKMPAPFADDRLPSLAELRKRISKTGRELSFPKMHLTIYGIRNGMLLGRRA